MNSRLLTCQNIQLLPAEVMRWYRTGYRGRKLDGKGHPGGERTTSPGGVCRSGKQAKDCTHN